jgi:uncharacterized protein involved in response to NO
MNPAAANPRWRFAWLYAAPHRLAFAAGAWMLALSATWWAVAMLAQSGGRALHFGMPPVQAHGLVMVLGFMPLFFSGFLFTAGPKWLRQPAVHAADLLSPIVAQLSGWLVFLLAAHGRDPAFGSVLGSLGLGAAAFGWTQLWWRFMAMLRASQADDKTHLRCVAVAGFAGAVCMWCAAAGVALSEPAWTRAALQGALWLFVGTTFVAVAHRMIPFLSAAAVPALDQRQPLWLLWLLVGLLATKGACEVALALAGPLPATAQWLQGAVEGAAGTVLLALAWRWSRVQDLRLRLIAMLHAGFVWLGLSFLLSGVSNVLAAQSGGELNLGLAPLHAFTLGFLGSTLIAMATRVSAGHGGRAVAADDIVWRLFWVLQAAALTRVAAGMFAALGLQGAMPLLAAAALGWCAVCSAWALRYGRWFGTP